MAVITPYIRTARLSSFAKQSYLIFFLFFSKEEKERDKDVVRVGKICLLSSVKGIGKIEITSWKARAYGIFTRFGEVSEIERVSAANE